MRLYALLLAIGVLCVLHPVLARAGTLVDLELVLAVDSSLSIDDGEFRIQLEGIARALRDPSVQAAIVSGEQRQIAIALVEWADATDRKDATGWYILSTRQSIEDFARRVESFPRTVTGSTGIGAGIAFAIDIMGSNDIESRRRVVDVSGDGFETPRSNSPAILLPAAHAMARDARVTVNGIAIMTEATGLDIWYREHVMFGPDCFVSKAPGLEDFPEAMRDKLVREILAKVAGIGRDPTHHAAVPKA